MNENPQNYKPRILIVDDETKNIQVLGTLLQQQKYYINVAQNGAEALEIVQTVLPDMILLDVMMPGMNGFEVCRQLKSWPETKDIPIIFLTVKSDTSDIIKGFELGAADYVTKPFNSVELMARVKTNLNLRMLQKRLETRNIELTTTNEKLVQEISERMAVEKKLCNYQEKLRLLHAEMLFIEERERRKIAIELHDNIGQDLALLKMKIRAVKKEINFNKIAEISNEMNDLTSQLIKKTRSLTFETSPPMLYELGFEVTIGWLIETFEKQYNLKIEYYNDDKTDIINERSKFILFRVIRELLLNIVRHSKARKAKVIINNDEKNISIIVKDYGIGFDISKLNACFNSNHSFGLFSIQERIEYIGGSIDIQSEPGKCTKVILLVPLEKILAAKV